MAADQPQIADESFAADIVSMTKQELYEIMCQMKDLIDQNKQQARQILIDNPHLSRGLFQAQIMLGMVNIPEVMPNIQETLLTPKSEHVGTLANAQPVPVQGGLQVQSTSSSQPSIPARQEHQTQPVISLPAVSAPSSTFQSQPLPSNSPHSIQQTQGLQNAPQILPLAPPSSQMHNMPFPPPATSQHSMVQPQMPMVSGQMQQSLQSTGMLHQPLHPPPPLQQLRPPSMQSFPHQSHSQMPHGFQASSAPQPLLSQTMFQPASNSPTLITTYQLPQQLYQGGPHFGPDYGNHNGGSIHAERGAPWGPENTTGGPQMMGTPPQMGPGQMAPSIGTQPPRPPPLTPEMEQVLLHQVMNLTPEQINLLPAEQRQQVIQLQQMLR